MTPPLSGGRLVKVKLSDIPITTRRFYGRYLLDSAADAADLSLAIAYKRAIEHPSEAEYLLPERAVRSVLG